MELQGDLTAWVAALNAGEVVAAPAEGVYGYCCDPFNDVALEKLMALKARDPKKGVICLIGDLSQLEQLCAPLSEQAQMLIMELWPCPQNAAVTLILPAKAGLPELLTGGRNTIAVRLPQTPYMQQYLSAWGQPLVSSSLNLSGEAPIVDKNDISAEIVALWLKNKLSGVVSQVVTADEMKKIR